MRVEQKVQELENELKILKAELKKERLKTPLKKIVRAFGPAYSQYECTIDKKYVLVPLPNANTEWTLSSFDWVKRFVERYPESYPEHGDSAGKKIFNPKYIYINCQQLKL
jgi:hypothetical protein